jgi:SAM-dependent methyltransferase
MPVEKRRTFNQVAELYHEVRPRYPAQLLDDLIELSGLLDRGRILEVGAGTGIATLPLAERGYEIIAVELGTDLAAVAENKLSSFANVEVVVADFEKWQLPDEPFDVVMSATAWHWIDPEIGYEKAAEALRPGGALAIFGYWHAAGGDQAFFEQVQDCYLRFMPGANPNERLKKPSEYEPDVSQVNASGLFERPTVRKYVTEETHSRNEYLDLLSTYSGHRALSEEDRQELFDCIGSLIDRKFGGQIRKVYVNELIVARKLHE